MVKLELAGKIEDNSKVQTELVRLKDEQKKTLELLQTKLEDLKRALLSKENEVSGLSARNASFAAELSRLHATHSHALQVLHEQIAAGERARIDSERDTQRLHRALCAQLKHALRRFTARVMFDDTADAVHPHTLRCPSASPFPSLTQLTCVRCAFVWPDSCSV